MMHALCRLPYVFWEPDMASVWLAPPTLRHWLSRDGSVPNGYRGSFVNTFTTVRSITSSA